MTAWTWMRYSYAWAVDYNDLGAHLQGYYVHLSKMPEELRDPTLVNALDYWTEDGTLVVPGRVYLRVPDWVGAASRGEPSPHFALDVSRFHPGSIAGLVIGAMGCFIFGLYLRGWLRERKALAGQPQGDMIA